MTNSASAQDVHPIAVIAGAGQGLGRAVALTFAAHGIDVVLVGRTASKLESVAAEVRALGRSPRVFPLDVTRSEQVQQLKADLLAAGPRIDMLINCVGEAFLMPVEGTTDADWERILGANLKGPFLMVRELMPLLRASDNASIINVSSKVALKGYGTVTAYSAAKAGLVGFTRSLADELREDEIRVVALCPGPMDTPMRWAATPDFDRKVVIDPDAVAATVLLVVQLPRGVSMGEVLIESLHYD
jgi:NAD(P)-dependent dehydrogenase (short-subunit alcohol dehydrogenase family)